MSSLLVLVFGNEGGANRMISEIQSLHQQQLITINDAATVVRKMDGRIKIKQVASLVGPDPLGGVFWGMLIGILFYLPWLGLSVNIVTHTLANKVNSYGIGDSFIKEIGAAIMPGYSALFIMVTTMREDRIIEAASKLKATLLSKKLSKNDEIMLRESFGAEELEV